MIRAHGIDTMASARTFGSERFLRDQEVAGSNPVTPNPDRESLPGETRRAQFQGIETPWLWPAFSFDPGLKRSLVIQVNRPIVAHGTAQGRFSDRPWVFISPSIGNTRQSRSNVRRTDGLCPPTSNTDARINTVEHSPLESGGLPDIPQQTLLEMATKQLACEVAKAMDALMRSADNVEQACYNSMPREYLAKQLRHAREYIQHAEGILVEHGCTIDLDDNVDLDKLVKVCRIGYYAVAHAVEGGDN